MLPDVHAACAEFLFHERIFFAAAEITVLQYYSYVSLMNNVWGAGECVEKRIVKIYLIIKFIIYIIYIIKIFPTFFF